MMAVVMLFIFGIANFAMLKVVIESKHPMISYAAPHYRLLGGRVGFGLEFVILLGAMALTNEGMMGWAWAYLIYSAVNAVSAWLILSGRI